MYISVTWKTNVWAGYRSRAIWRLIWVLKDYADILHQMLKHVNFFCCSANCICLFLCGVGRLSEVGSLLSPFTSQVSNSGHQSWQQAPLPTESSHRPTWNNFSLKISFLSFYFVSVGVLTVHVCVSRACSSQRGQERAADSLQLKLQLVLSCYVDAGVQTLVFWKSSHCFLVLSQICRPQQHLF